MSTDGDHNSRDHWDAEDHYVPRYYGSRVWVRNMDDITALQADEIAPVEKENIPEDTPTVDWRMTRSMARKKTVDAPRQEENNLSEDEQALELYAKDMAATDDLGPKLFIEQ